MQTLDQKSDLAEPTTQPSEEAIKKVAIKEAEIETTHIKETEKTQLTPVSESLETRNNRIQLLKNIRDELTSTLTDNITALKRRTGVGAVVIDTNFLTRHTNDFNEVQIKSEIEALHDLDVQIQREVIQLEQRIAQRKASPQKADLVQIYVAEATIEKADQIYKTLPLVGEWTRGESRTVHIKDRDLFNSQFSENITISFSESYRLIINDQNIMQVDSNTAKKDTLFQIKSLDKTADISGQINYKIK